jgi:hypothetical protein
MMPFLMRKVIILLVFLLVIFDDTVQSASIVAEAEKPVSNVIAECPTYPPSAEFPPGPNEDCQSDTICDIKYPGRGMKCCNDGCDFRCMFPVIKSIPPVITPSVFPGTCPIFPPPAECLPELEHECLDDGTCEQGQKCCKDGCDMRCVSPIPVKPRPNAARPGCPIFPQPAECPPEPDDECLDDGKCDELHPSLGLKCCKDGCDFRCVPPLPPAP